MSFLVWEIKCADCRSVKIMIKKEKQQKSPTAHSRRCKWSWLCKRVFQELLRTLAACLWKQRGRTGFCTEKAQKLPVPAQGWAGHTRSEQHLRLRKLPASFRRATFDNATNEGFMVFRTQQNSLFPIPCFTVHPFPSPLPPGEPCSSSHAAESTQNKAAHRCRSSSIPLLSVPLGKIHTLLFILSFREQTLHLQNHPYQTAGTGFAYLITWASDKGIFLPSQKSLLLCLEKENKNKSQAHTNT